MLLGASRDARERGEVLGQEQWGFPLYCGSPLLHLGLLLDLLDRLSWFIFSGAGASPPRSSEAMPGSAPRSRDSSMSIL